MVLVITPVMSRHYLPRLGVGLDIWWGRWNFLITKRWHGSCIKDWGCIKILRSPTMTILKKGDNISFKQGSEAWQQHPCQIWEVDYVNPGCQDLNCVHDDCWREPFVVVRQNSWQGFALKDVHMIFGEDHRGREVNNNE